MNVLIVEDEKGLSKEIETFLKKEHFLTDTAFTGAEASEKIAVNLYDFVLLDLGLPDYEGFDLLKEAKKSGSDASFIILTAREAVQDKVQGLNMGADDYLAKPFSLLELLSRMKAINRRKFGVKSTDITLGDFVISLENRAVSCNGNPVNLTKKEFDLLTYLLLHKNRVLTRLQLTEHIWGNMLEDDYDSNYIDVHIKNLRKKMGQHGSTDWLETVRGIGYRINA
ncbi:response regulator transcription factor [Adhaeribacter soli]|uniref:Response regulator transcription factor n=1 Tax=Adhaeribacter soli TaxID=2607655 RepID=A0A5N1ITN3_9BACT|nr:response regulator transcription factor [Adhaeribacter soli]KAA9333525.1 response regulator transcription factor [Adhaeribacter soli]